MRRVLILAAIGAVLCTPARLNAGQSDLVQPEVLALAREVAAERADKFWHLYDPVLSQPLSRQWVASDKWLFGTIRSYLMHGNPGRDEEIDDFLIGALHSLVLERRDDFVCLVTRRNYLKEMSFVDGGDAEGRAKRLEFLRKHRKLVVFDAHRIDLRWDLYHFIWLSWDALQARSFRVYGLTETLEVEVGEELTHPQISRIDQIFFDSLNPCGAPWASQATPL